MIHDVVLFIQSMLAPGLMISACSLLLLGTNNKYSLVVNRIRALDEERRKLLIQQHQQELKPWEVERLKNIDEQLLLFFERVRHIKLAVTMYIVGIAFFILTSLLIGLSFIIPLHYYFVVGIFIGGMICVFAGVLKMLKEIGMSYRIIKIEIFGTMTFLDKQKKNNL
ncbi:MAG: DUF2721 domain-containing protein [Bacteroidales bacterium]|nr:DUF2721 domain-containing protein [Bacteroidales bacterium]